MHTVQHSLSLSLLTSIPLFLRFCTCEYHVWMSWIESLDMVLLFQPIWQYNVLLFKWKGSLKALPLSILSLSCVHTWGGSGVRPVKWYNQLLNSAQKIFFPHEHGTCTCHHNLWTTLSLTVLPYVSLSLFWIRYITFLLTHKLPETKACDCSCQCVPESHWFLSYRQKVAKPRMLLVHPDALT